MKRMILGGLMMVLGNLNYGADNPGVFNVKEFGARGDGVTDDTLAVQKAFEQVRQSESGGTVLFPNGKFIITKPIDARYSYPKGLSIIGTGSRQSAIIYKGEGVLFDIVSSSEGHSGFIDTFMMKDLFLQGSNKKGTTAIRLKNFETPFLIENCRFELWGDFAVILDKYAMEGTIRLCAFNTNARGILFNGYNDRVVLEETSFWRHEYESLKICSSRVRVQNCFFGKAGTAVLFSKGPLQAGIWSSFLFCDFEGQRDMKCFVQIGDENSAQSIFRGLKFIRCRFGVNPKTLKQGLAGDALLAADSKKEAHDIPVCFLINRPLRESEIEGCNFVNIKKYAVEAAIPAADLKECVHNNYELNSIENALDAKGIHFAPGTENIFSYITKNYPAADEKK